MNEMNKASKVFSIFHNPTTEGIKFFPRSLQNGLLFHNISTLFHAYFHLGFYICLVPFRFVIKNNSVTLHRSIFQQVRNKSLVFHINSAVINSKFFQIFCVIVHTFSLVRYVTLIRSVEVAAISKSPVKFFHLLERCASLIFHFTHYRILWTNGKYFESLIRCLEKYRLNNSSTQFSKVYISIEQIT